MLKKIVTHDNFKYVFYSILIALSLGINLEESKYIFRDLPWILGFIFFFAIYICLKKYKDLKINIPICILSIILSICYIIFFFIDKYNSVANIYLNYVQIFKTFFCLIGYSLAAYYSISILYLYLSKHKYKASKKKLINFIFEDHPFISSFIIILLCYIVVAFIFYPGVVFNDGFDEIRQYNHTDTWTIHLMNLVDENVYINGHHSPFHTVFLGGLLNFFSTFVSQSNAMLFVTIIQVIIQSLVLAYSMQLLSKLKVNNVVRIIILLLYCIHPIFAVNAVGIFKDIPFSFMILLYTCFLIEYTYLNEHGKKNLIKIILCSIIIILLSNKGFYVVLFTTIPLLIKYRKTKKLLIALLIPIIFYYSYQYVILPYFHITNVSVREKLVLPMQQIGNYVKLYDEEISDEDKETINKVLRYDKIARYYGEYNADPLKNMLFNENCTKEELREFMKVWMKLFFKHPCAYIQAQINTVYGFLYPGKINEMVYWETTSSEYNSDKLNNILRVKNIYAINKIKKFWINTSKLPVFSILWSNSFYTISLILLSFYLLINKKIKYLIPFISSLVILLFCFVSPVNGHSRYIIPIMYCIPVLYSYVLVLNKDNNN